MPRRPRRIEEAARLRLVEKSSDRGSHPSSPAADPPDEDPTHPGDAVRATADGDGVLLSVGDDSYVLDRSDAVRLRASLGEALTRRREFLHTAGEHREDGSYVVERRGASSSGHRKVFDSFEGVERLYRRLPAAFTADAVAQRGLTGGRRHMLVRHFVEHPAFDCELASRQPLTARKGGRSPTEVD